MKIQGVEIKNHHLVKRIPSLREVRTLYCGSFYCKDKALHGSLYYQTSLTKVAWTDEYGKRHWGEPETIFKLQDGAIPFRTLEELIDFYNSAIEMREVECKGFLFNVSEDGKVILSEGRRIPTHFTHPRGRGDHRLCFRRTMISVKKLVALAYIGKPPRQRMSIHFKDGNVHNLHYSNLYYSNKRTPDMLQNKPDPNSERSKKGKNTLNKRK